MNARNHLLRAVRVSRSYACMVAIAFAGLVAIPGHAGFITVDEPGMDAIYSQTSFSNTPIDIRFTDPLLIHNPSLVSIDTEAELDALFALQPSPQPGVNVFFVDAINACGGPAPGTIGCGQQPGNSFAVHSLTAAGSLGAALLSHELGHNLGLEHVGEAVPNLMNTVLTGDTSLTGDQARTVFVSPLVQVENAVAYIVLTPIAVVPEPGSLALAAGGLLMLYLLAPRRPAMRVAAPAH